MMLKTTTIINGVEVVDTGKKLLGHSIFTNVFKDGDTDLVLYVVAPSGEVKSVLNIEADMGQGIGYVSDWTVTNY